MAFRPVIAFRQKLGGHGSNDIAVFRMHQRQCAEFGAALEGGEHLVIVHHQGPFIGHEVLEVLMPLS